MATRSVFIGRQLASNNFGESCSAFIEGHDTGWKANEDQWAWISDATMDAILKLSPMRCRLAEFISDKLPSECFVEG